MIARFEPDMELKAPELVRAVEKALTEDAALKATEHVVSMR